MSQARQVVITGAAMATPAGYAIEDNVAAWRQGKACFKEISLFKWENSQVRFAGECVAPDAKKLPDRKVPELLRRGPDNMVENRGG